MQDRLWLQCSRCLPVTLLALHCLNNHHSTIIRKQDHNPQEGLYPINPQANQRPYLLMMHRLLEFMQDNIPKYNQCYNINQSCIYSACSFFPSLIVIRLYLSSSSYAIIDSTCINKLYVATCTFRSHVS